MFNMSATTAEAVGPDPAPGPKNITWPIGFPSTSIALFTPLTPANGLSSGTNVGSTQIDNG